MAETEQNKTEEPTPFKLRRAREKGQVARGTDLGFFAVLVGLALYALTAGAGFLRLLAAIMQHSITSIGAGGAEPEAVLRTLSFAPQRILEAIGLLGLTIILTVLLFEIIQLRGVVISTHPLKPDFGRLNPGKGLKRLFSLRMLKETLKNIAKLGAYACVAFLIARNGFDDLTRSAPTTAALVDGALATAMRLLFAFILVALIVAAIDQVIVRREFLKQMRMSRSELNREVKDREGEPRIKRRRKQLHAEFAKQTRALGNLKGSDLLIVNPEHFAVALSYDAKKMNAPKVTAKGRNSFALLLKSRARLLSIPIFEAPLLARALYRKCDTGAEVPQEDYRPVVDLYLKLAQAGERTGGELR